MQVGDPITEGWGIYGRFWRHLLPVACMYFRLEAVHEPTGVPAGAAFADE